MGTEEKQVITTEKKTIWLRLVEFQIRNRNIMLIAISLVTAFFIYQAATVRIHTDFFQLYPPGHPYIKLYKEYRNMFGTANVMSIVVEVKKGDIYNAETINKVDRITRDLLVIKGVNPLQVISITHPKLKDISIGAWGITVQPLIHPKIPETKDELEKFKKKVYSNEGIRGIYITPDDKATLIHAGFWEEGVDMRLLYNEMDKLKKREDDASHTIYITGYPMLYAWIHHYVPQIAWVLVITGCVLTILLWVYFRSLLGVVAPLASGVVSAVWGLGFAGALGFTLDPLILVIPLLLSARALSHSVQGNERYHEEYARLGDKEKALIFTYANIYKPAILGIGTDGLGVLTIAVASIPLMRNLAFFACFWIASIFASSIILHPVLVALLPAPKGKIGHKLSTDLKFATKEVEEIERSFRPADKVYVGMTKALLFLSEGRKKWIVAGILLLIITVGNWYAGTTLKVGDTSAGKAILYKDHPYNIAADKVNKDFIGASQLVVIAEGKKEGAMKNAESLKLLEDMGLYSQDNIPHVGGALTITDIVKRIFRMFHEGDPKWGVLPEEPSHLSQVFFIIEGSMAPGEMDRFISMPGYTNATITMYFRDYNNQTIKEAINTVKKFIEENPAKEITFRLAGGILGVLAAVNEEVEWSFWVNMVVIFTVIFGLYWLTYRSLLCAGVLIAHMVAAEVLCNLIMIALGIDLNINSLPVAALGVGVGDDYGLYIMSRLAEEFQWSKGDYDGARYTAITSTGKAVVFTATTLVSGCIFWVFSSFKFQAEMGILLAFLMAANAVGALVVLPSLVGIIGPQKLLPKYRVAEEKE